MFSDWDNYVFPTVARILYSNLEKSQGFEQWISRQVSYPTKEIGATQSSLHTFLYYLVYCSTKLIKINWFEVNW